MRRPGAAEGPSPVSGGRASRRGRVRAGAQRATGRFLSRVPGSLKLLKEGAWIFTVYEKGATSDFISGRQIWPPAADPERQDDFLKLVSFSPPTLFPFSPFCFFRGPSLPAKTPCAPPRAAPPGRPEGPHRRPPVRPGLRARRRAQAPLAAAAMHAAEPPPPEDSGTTPRPNF